MKIDDLIKPEKIIMNPINNGKDGYSFEIEGKLIILKRNEHFKFEAFLNDKKILSNGLDIYEISKKAVVYVLTGRSE